MVISITRECDGCIVAHTRGALREGASRQQVAEAIGVAIAMNGGPGTVWGPRAFTPTRSGGRGEGVMVVVPVFDAAIEARLH